MKLGMTDDVHRHSEAVTCFHSDAAKLKTRNRDSMVGDNLIVIPPCTTAHDALMFIV